MNVEYEVVARSLSQVFSGTALTVLFTPNLYKKAKKKVTVIAI